MTYIGFDHHKKWTQAAAIDDQVKVIREMRVLNDSCSLKGFLSRIVKRLAESKSKDLTLIIITLIIISMRTRDLQTRG